MMRLMAGARGHAHAEEQALIGSDTSLSRAQLSQAVLRESLKLSKLGCRIVGLLADNGPAWVLIDLVLAKANMVSVPLPQFFSVLQLAHVLEDTGADTVITDQPDRIDSLALGFEAVAVSLPFGLTMLQRPLCDDSWRNLPGATSKISYTSGTTNKPKGVLLSRSSMTAVATSLHRATRRMTIKRHLCLLPLAVLLENIAGVYTSMIAGAQCIVPALAQVGTQTAASLDVESLLESLTRYEPDSIILLPQMLLALVEAIESGRTLPPSPKLAAVGGGHVTTRLLERASACGLPVFEGYGLTECCSVVSLNTPAHSRAGSVGRPLPHAQVRLAADAEILVSGPIMEGYLGKEDRAVEEVATGDLGHFDDAGFLYIHGRKKNVFITSFGRNISPEWVESELAERGEIAQAMVFGEGKPWVVALIVPSSATMGPQEIENAIRDVNAVLPDYARVRQWASVTPFSTENGLLTPNGRLRRIAIQQRYHDIIGGLYGPDNESFNSRHSRITA